MKRLIFCIYCLLIVIGCSNKEEKNNNKTTEILEEYVYIDKANIIHANSKCNAIYKKYSAQPITPIIPRHIWCPKSSAPQFCSKCVSSQQMRQLLNILSSDAYKDRLWLFEKMEEDYSDTPSWNEFNIFLDSRNNRKELYDVIKDKYNIGSFEEFDSTITNYGFNKRKTKTQL